MMRQMRFCVRRSLRCSEGDISPYGLRLRSYFYWEGYLKETAKDAVFCRFCYILSS